MIFLILIIILIGVLIFYRVSTPSITNNQRYLLIFLRFIYISIVAILLFNPVLHYVKKLVLKDKIIILVDDSQSMSLKNNGVKKETQFSNIQKQIIDKCKVNNLEYSVEHLSNYNTLKDKSSLLLPFVEEMKKKDNFDVNKAIFLLSDGHFHDEDLAFIDSVNLPFYTFNFQDSTKNADLSINDVAYNKTAYKSENTIIKAFINKQDINSDYKVQLLVDGKVVQEKKIPKNNLSIDTVEFEYQFTKTGLMPFNLKVISANDQYTSNNQYPGAIQVLESKQKIAIITDNLNFDLRYLAQLIRDNERYEAEIIIQTNHRYFINSKEIKLSFGNYSSLILINNSRLVFSPQEKSVIENLCNNNFGILIIGYPIASLENLSPTQISNIKNTYRAGINLTPLSNQFELFDYLRKDLDNLPLLQYYYVTAKSNTQVLGVMDNESKSPFITYLSYLNSNIIQINAFDLWKWKSSDPNNQYEAFFNYLVDWISRKKSDNFYAYTKKNSYNYGEKVDLILNAYDESLNPMTNISPKVILKHNNLTINEDYLSLSESDYRINFTSLKPGKYTYEISENRKKLFTKGEFIINNINRELYDTGFNQGLLSWISNISGGEFLTKQAFENLLLKADAVKTIKQDTEIQLYKKTLLIIFFILAISLEYFFRKRWGLL